MNANVRVEIDLDQPDSKVLIYHEIKAQQFEAIAAPSRIYSLMGGHITVIGEVFHPLEEVALEVEPMLWPFLAEVFFELVERDVVALLMLTVIALVLHLQAVVGQMYIFVFQIARVVKTGRAEIAVVKEIKVLLAGSEAPDTDVKLTTLVEKWLLDVFLNNPVGTVGLFFEIGLNLVDFVEHSNATALVLGGGLDHPYVVGTVLFRHPLIRHIVGLIFQLFEPGTEGVVLVSVQAGGNDKCGRCCVENIMVLILIISAERLNQSSFRC